MQLEFFFNIIFDYTILIKSSFIERKTIVFIRNRRLRLKFLYKEFLLDQIFFQTFLKFQIEYFYLKKDGMLFSMKVYQILKKVNKSA